jgi:uncharacterized protein YjiS (DUF1127 family)
MAHHVARGAYARLTDRLNRFPQGAPPAESLFRILRVLFSEREAELVSLLPIKPFSAARAAAAWRVSEAEARRTLEALAARALGALAAQRADIKAIAAQAGLQSRIIQLRVV